MPNRRVRVTARRRETIDINSLVRLLIAQVRSMQETRKAESEAPDTPDRGAA